MSGQDSDIWGQIQVITFRIITITVACGRDQYRTVEVRRRVSTWRRRGSPEGHASWQEFSIEQSKPPEGEHLAKTGLARRPCKLAGIQYRTVEARRAQAGAAAGRRRRPELPGRSVGAKEALAERAEAEHSEAMQGSRIFASSCPVACVGAGGGAAASLCGYPKKKALPEER